MKYFLFNHSGCLNHGCEAILRGTVNIICNYDIGAEFIVSSYNAESDSIVPSLSSNQFEFKKLTGVEKAIAYLDLKIKKSEKYALKKMYSNVVRQAQDCDVCLSVGGDTYCYGDNSGIQVLTEDLKKAGKKVVLWGASIGEDDLTDDKLRNLGMFDAVFARESLTYNLLKKKNANDNLFLFSDPAFCMEREDVNLPDGFTKENTIGINVSPLIEKYNSKIFDIVEDFIKFLLDNTTLKVLLVPHVVEENNSDFDYMLPYAKTFENTGRVLILSPELNAMQYKGYIAKTRFFIGARTHATIASYSSGVPTFVLGYSVKSKGIATDLFGNDDYVLDVKNIESADMLINAFNVLLKDEIKIKENLMRKIPLQLRSAMQMGEQILKL